MKNLIPNRFVIIENNQPIGVDGASGGYPFNTENPFLIRWWKDKEEAEKYWKVINWNGKRPVEIKEVEFVIKD